ncbi:MAG: DNA polymerase/3'-5' exonuclease PolX [Candidatus Aegiribacteria sp.]|nr:DNA polymerase/3'-5' exonuclease PolX [Candidatus Aegiribacteria sp.]MBD3295501.1 DNA polymerase/3'-5' exonuclease PolX [Candidatus Fermentibacteria bacterium]
MPVHNSDVSEVFRTVADLLDIKDDNPFRIRAYRNGARTVDSLSGNIADMLEEGEDLSELPDIGKDLAGKKETIVHTGSLPMLEELEKDYPRSLRDLLKVSGLGPRKVADIHRQLGVTDLHGLQKAVETGSVRDLDGFGEKTENRIRRELEKIDLEEERTLLRQAMDLARPLVEYLKNIEGVEEVEVAGSLRRRKETVGDLDILVTGDGEAGVMDAFVEYSEVESVVQKGDTRTTVLLGSGIQVDLRVVSPSSFGAALVYFTGSKSHNIRLRRRGQDRDLKINEYGAFRGEEKVAGKTEEEVYHSVDLPLVVPELREDRGEIEAAEKNELPRLVTMDDIRGDLHMHTDRTDGHNTITEMAEACRERGYDYMAITEHSSNIAVTGGLNEEELEDHLELIEEANAKVEGIEILKGIEVDILKDGSLDLDGESLSRLDVVIGSVHSHFDLPMDRQTKRVIKAMENPNFMILGHPTGRKLNQREPIRIDLDSVFDAAAELGCFMELNAYPIRLDLTDTACMSTKDKGVGIVINTDAHRIHHLDYMRFGIFQARRGWLEASDVINTGSLIDLRDLLGRD